jgi:hypothetical protein
LAAAPAAAPAAPHLYLLHVLDLLQLCHDLVSMPGVSAEGVGLEVSSHLGNLAVGVTVTPQHVLQSSREVACTDLIATVAAAVGGG